MIGQISKPVGNVMYIFFLWPNITLVASGSKEMKIELAALLLEYVKVITVNRNGESGRNQSVFCRKLCTFICFF